jgi:large subunit ribosomal protein L15
MPVHFRRYARKRRANRRFGHGRGLRKSGMRGGTGIAKGKFKHMKSYFMVQKKLGFPEPKWEMGYTGFKVPPDIKRLRTKNAINIMKLEEVIDCWVQEGKALKNGQTYVIDLSTVKIHKLLGRGKVTKKWEITVGYASAGIIEKMKEANCKLTLTAPVEEEK